MNKTVKTIIAAVVFVAVIAMAFTAYNALIKDYSDKTPDEMNEPNMEAVSDKAPDFTVYDKDGSEISLSSFEGKPVVINFWTSWCSYCKREFPSFQTAFETYGNDVEFVMIALTEDWNDTQEDAAALMKDNDYSFPTYYDSDSDAYVKYNVASIPTTIFVDSEGYLYFSKVGMISEELLNKNINEMLEK